MVVKLLSISTPPLIRGLVDSVDGIIALGWEMDEDVKNRLVFRFGETEENIKNKLYSRDLILEFEKISVYEN